MNEEQKSQGFWPFRSMTRLLVGGLILGSGALKNRLQTWDDPHSQPPSQDEAPQGQTPAGFDPLPEQLPPPGLAQKSQQNNAADLRYALIGLLFEGEDQLEKGLALSRRVGNLTLRAVNPLLSPLHKIPNPSQKRFDQLVQRGQSEVDRWIRRGREEAYQSQQLAQEAAISTVDESITYMAQNPALEELVQQQSVSFANQILEQIRENAVNADYFFEGLVRYALRRPPRYLLPPPSPEIRAQAAWKFRDLRQEEL